MPTVETGSKSFRDNQTRIDISLQVFGYVPYRGKTAKDWSDVRIEWAQKIQTARERTGMAYAWYAINGSIRQIQISSLNNLTMDQALALAQQFKLELGLEHVQIVEQLRSYKRYHV